LRDDNIALYIIPVSVAFGQDISCPQNALKEQGIIRKNQMLKNFFAGHPHKTASL
jgi:hypothetical protein